MMLVDKSKTLGVVLAGGLSTRMGCDKANLMYQGKTFLDHMIEQLSHLGVGRVLVSGDRQGYNCVADCVFYGGPAVGLYSVAQYYQGSTFEHLLFVPVDMPLLNAELLSQLVEQEASFNAVAFENQPLPCLIRIREFLLCFNSVQHCTDVSMHQVLEQLNAHMVSLRPGFREQLFNINYPKDLNVIQH